MLQMGRVNTMTILRDTPQGLYLEAQNPEVPSGPGDGILLPQRYVTGDMKFGEALRVFVYRDSEGRPVATTQTPKVQVGEFANLRVVNLHEKVGVFLDWGLSKDLLLPFRERGKRLLGVGDRVIVAVYLDTSDRIVATPRLDRHFAQNIPTWAANEPVNALIYGESPLGYKAIVNKTHSGLLYRSETSDVLNAGDEVVAYVNAVHPDGKIDLRRDPAGYGRVDAVSRTILDQLDAAGGALPFNDKSTPADIRAAFGTSKKAFKQALGALYKQRKIQFTDTGIEKTPA